VDDLNLTVLVQRDSLGLTPLSINDGKVYRASTQFLGGAVSWNRTQVTSPYIDGSVTVNRQRQMVQEQVAIEVSGRTVASPTLSNVQLKANFDTLCQAFLQDSFTLTVEIDTAVYEYQCEAADYQITWTGPRFIAKQGLITFTVPRQPNAAVGVV
jgi:hypothetical protein